MSEIIDLILIFIAHGGLEANPSGTDVTFFVGRLFTNQTLELAWSQNDYLSRQSRLVVVEFLPQIHSRIFFFDKYQVCWSHPSQVECREDTRDTCVLEEVVDPRMTRDGTSVSKMWTLWKVNNLEKKEEETLAMEVEVTIFYRESDGLSDDRSKTCSKICEHYKKKGGKVSERQKSCVTEDTSRLQKITLPDYVVNWVSQWFDKLVADA